MTIHENGIANTIINRYTYYYDSDKIATQTDPNGNVTINTYNQGNLIKKQQSGSAGNIITAYDVDLKGRVIKEVSPENYIANGDGTPNWTAINHTEYTYDASDRVIVKRYHLS